MKKEEKQATGEEQGEAREEERDREREKRGPVSCRKEAWRTERGRGGWAKIWLTHGVHNGLYRGGETKPQKTPVNGSQYAETAAE